jgi:hypothetical protein
VPSQSAADHCGVVIREGRIDTPATEAKRKVLRTKHGASNFDFGPERDKLESL